MKARRNGICHECWDEIDKGEEVVYRDVTGTGQRSMIHATHINLPKRHLDTFGKRWGGGADPTTPGRNGRKSRSEERKTIAVYDPETKKRIYLGTAGSKEEAEELRRKHYDEVCVDREACHHRCHVADRGGPMSYAERQRRRQDKIRAGMPRYEQAS